MPLTIEQPKHIHGVLRAVRTNTGKCAIVWTWRDREVWLWERPEAGPKLALYNFLKHGMPREAERKMLKCEADAEHILFQERERAMDEMVEEFSFVIESDPYVVA